MTIQPTGSPAWTRTATMTDYGGSTSKENYGGRDAINPLTDVDATEFSRMVSDLAAAVRTAPFAVMTIQCQDTHHRNAEDPAHPLPGPGEPIVEYAALQTAVRANGYLEGAPPAGFPTVARTGNGDITITFATTYADDYGVVGAFTPRAAEAGLAGTVCGSVNVLVVGQLVRCQARGTSGAAVADAKLSVVVF